MSTRYAVDQHTFGDPKDHDRTIALSETLRSSTRVEVKRYPDTTTVPLSAYDTPRVRGEIEQLGWMGRADAPTGFISIARSAINTLVTNIAIGLVQPLTRETTPVTPTLERAVEVLMIVAFQKVEMFRWAWAEQLRYRQSAGWTTRHSRA